jgi:hypothetical protein
VVIHKPEQLHLSRRETTLVGFKAQVRRPFADGGGIEWALFSAAIFGELQYGEVARGDEFGDWHRDASFNFHQPIEGGNAFPSWKAPIHG